MPVMLITSNSVVDACHGEQNGICFTAGEDVAIVFVVVAMSKMTLGRQEKCPFFFFLPDGFLFLSQIRNNKITTTKQNKTKVILCVQHVFPL